jgi:hypothetical protein
VVHNRITHAGLELLARLDGPVDRADDEVLAMLEPQEQARLAKLLRKTLASQVAACEDDQE